MAGLGMVEQEARGLAGTGSRHGRSATSMETMDMEDRAVCMVVQAPPQGDRAQGAYRWFPLRGSRNKSPEEEEQCRRRRSSVEGVDTAQEDRSGARGPPVQYSMKRVLSGERAGAASLVTLRRGI
ncbi:uncharacterized protein UHOD_11201 [Ustilago sp. UG-2017b]|nr:uncharacterized protein UHOD_11201 [Ustilago sp. UG-2017b]